MNISRVRKPTVKSKSVNISLYKVSLGFRRLS